MINFSKMETTTLVAVISVVLGMLLLFGGIIGQGSGIQNTQTPTLPPTVLQELETSTITPAPRPTTAYVRTNNPLSVALSGEYGNGGIWQWQDIANLMGVYSTTNTLLTVTHEGQRYEGVPLAYLLHFAAVNTYADTLLITDQDNSIHAYLIGPLQNCANCILAATEQDTLVAILPGFEPRFVDGVRRLDTATNADASRELADAAEAERLANNPTIRIYGQIQGPEAWTWEDITNLLGIYDTPNHFQRRTVDGETYQGVPLSYLLHYVQMDSTANSIQATEGGGLKQLYIFNHLEELSNFLVAQATNGSFVLLVPDGSDTAVLPGLVNLNVQSVANPNIIPADSQSINLFGEFQQGGVWAWVDISNLMGVYEEYGSQHTIELNGTTYSGVPIVYLLNYADRSNNRADLLSLYNRDGLYQSMPLNTLKACLDCLIVAEADNTLTLILPDQSPPLFPKLAALEIH